MKILLTGATGFIGSAVMRLAMSRGHEVAALVRPGKNLPSVRPLIGTLDNAPWNEIAAFQPEVCIHAAWIATPGVYLESPENFLYADWSLHFAQKLAALGTKHFIALGTCIEYAASNQPLSEDHSPLASASVYARCKETLRQSLEKEFTKRSFGVCWGRVFYPYGPGEHPSRLCTSVIQQLVTDQPVLVKTPQSVKDYIFVDDLAAAILMVMEKRFCGCINFGTGSGVSVLELVETIATALQAPLDVKITSPAAPDPFPQMIADVSRLRGLGWRPKISLSDGIRELARSLNVLSD